MPERPSASGSLEVWRISAARTADRAFEGEGARRFGGRWNHPGTPIVYASDSLALAALEVFVHLEPDIAPEDLVAIAATIPMRLGVARLEEADLPPGWRAYPAPSGLQDLGTAWARAGETVGLSVPSAVIPAERNILLNPRHPEFSEITFSAPQPFSFDPRMWK